MSAYLDRLVGKLGYSTYEGYLKSKHWIQFCKWVKKTRCYCCGYCVRLQVHHTHYYSLGNEVPDDVVTVCNRCHKSIHQLSGAGTPLVKAHIVHRQSLSTRVRTIKESRNKWVHWMSLLNRSKKQTIAELKLFLVEHKLWSDTGCSLLAEKLKMVKLVDGKWKWHLGRYIKFMHRCKKNVKRAMQNKPPLRHGAS